MEACVILFAHPEKSETDRVRHMLSISIVHNLSINLDLSSLPFGANKPDALN